MSNLGPRNGWCAFPTLTFGGLRQILVGRAIRPMPAGNTMAGKIMSHGVPLPDLFDILPIEEAQRQFLLALHAMRSLCFRLIDAGRVAA
jgi:hypothetical protein